MFRSCHETGYAGSKWAVLSFENGDGTVAQDALVRSSAVKDALRYITSALFSTLHTLV